MGLIHGLVQFNVVPSYHLIGLDWFGLKQIGSFHVVNPLVNWVWRAFQVLFTSN
jgi:hypothetical protein